MSNETPEEVALRVHLQAVEYSNSRGGTKREIEEALIGYMQGYVDATEKMNEGLKEQLERMK